MQTSILHVNKLTNKTLTLGSDELFKSPTCYEINDTKIVSVLCPHFDKNLLAVRLNDGVLKISFYAENHVYFGHIDDSISITVGNVTVFDYFIVDSVLQVILKPN